MLIRMVEVMEVREVREPLDKGHHLKTKLQSQSSDGRMVYIEIDQPLNDPSRFSMREEMVLVLMPSRSLLAHVAKALADGASD